MNAFISLAEMCAIIVCDSSLRIARKSHALLYIKRMSIDIKKQIYVSLL
jgi:hypothetical protein